MIKTINENSNYTSKWRLDGPQGNNWFNGQLPIYSTDEDFFIYFEGIIGDGYYSDIGNNLLEIQFKN